MSSLRLCCLFIIFASTSVWADPLNLHEIDKNLWWLEQDSVQKETWLNKERAKSQAYFDNLGSLKSKISDFNDTVDSGNSTAETFMAGLTEIEVLRGGAMDKITLMDPTAQRSRSFFASSFVYGADPSKARIKSVRMRNDQKAFELLIVTAGDISFYNWVLIDLEDFSVKYNFPQVENHVSWNEEGDYDQFTYWQKVKNDKVYKHHIVSFDRNSDGVENSRDSFIKNKFALSLSFSSSLLNESSFINFGEPYKLLQASDSDQPNGSVSLVEAKDISELFGDSKKETQFIVSKEKAAIKSIKVDGERGLMAVYYRWGTRHWIEVYDVSDEGLKTKAADRVAKQSIDLPGCSYATDFTFIDDEMIAGESRLQINTISCLHASYRFAVGIESGIYYDYNGLPSSQAAIHQVTSQFLLNGTWHVASVYGLEAPTTDGSPEPVPYYLVTVQGATNDSPALVKAYGGFTRDFLGEGGTQLDSFDKKFLLDGGSVVFAGVRGGSEKGLSWYQGGANENILNSGLDMIAVAKDLASRGLSKASKIAITGTSNGGLVTAMALTQSPESFGLAIPVNGVLDLIRADYLDPQNHGFAYEYGSAINPKTLQKFASTSPLAQAKKQDYPAVLILVGDKDDRVNPVHSYKLYQKLTENQTSQQPIILGFVEDGGHNPSVDLNSSVRRDYQVQKWTTIYDQFQLEFK